jgi:putative RNA 2'-phosphotransferase
LKKTLKKTMKNNNAIQHSKFLSLVLRHKPQTIGIELDENGWVDIDTLIQKMNDFGKNLTREELYFMVENNPKKRFAINEVTHQIRANQGHSIKINSRFCPYPTS